MRIKIFRVGDLKNGENKTWNYPSYQINITEEGETFFPPLHEIFKIQLKFPKGKIIDEKGNEYSDGTFFTKIIKDHPNRFGKGTVYAICTISKNKGTRDGILHGWLKAYNLQPEDKIKISLKDNKYYLEPFEEITN